VPENVRDGSAPEYMPDDTILVATAVCAGATIVTCDHAELEPVEKPGIVPFLWIRDKSWLFIGTVPYSMLW
jgi:hypothetical protein